MTDLITTCLAQTATDPSVTSRQSSAANFEAMLEPCRVEPNEIYLEPPNSSSPAPLQHLIERIGAIAKMPGSTGEIFQSNSTQTQYENTGAHSSDGAMDRLRAANNDIIRMQQELMRLTMTVETINSTKQGVTTLFQSQG